MAGPRWLNSLVVPKGDWTGTRGSNRSTRPGFEIETTNQLLSEVKAEIPEAIEQVRVASSASIKVHLIESVNLLRERAVADPRNAMKRAWELLGHAVLRAADVSGENVQPDSEEISTSLKRLEADTRYPRELIRAIESLQQIAKKVFTQSQWVYDPSPGEAEQFVLYTAAARKELGETVN
jgi:hypothetical protein